MATATPQFVDISAFQVNVDWNAYAAWARQWDGIARVAIKASEGVGFVDPRFRANQAGALAAGIDVIIYYHFARPDLGNSAAAEAHSMHSVVSNARESDIIILDYEVASSYATADWAYAWLTTAEQLSGRLPGLYASSAYIAQRLQDPRLAKYPLWLANWQYDPNERPACPAPWKSYMAAQYTDRASGIPGVPGTVDADIFLHVGGSMIPTGWKDDGTTLTASNGVLVTTGFRQYILTHTWDPGNVPQEAEYGAIPAALHRPDLGGGTRQVFRDNLLWWTQSTGVVCEAFIGLELDAAYKALAAVPNTTVTKIPDAVLADIKQLSHDAGL